jgi:hypothetical protein
MNPIAVTAIQAMVAPVVLITTAAILSGALLTMYGSVNDRMPAMDRERLDILTGTAGTLGRALVRRTIDHDLHGRDRLRSAAGPVTRVLITAHADAWPAE